MARTLFAFALGAMLAGGSFLWGESGSGLSMMGAAAATIVPGSLVIGLVLPAPRAARVLATLASLALAGGAFFMGQRMFGEAFAQCVARSEEVRLALAEYRAAHRAFPQSLGELERPLPCGRVALPNLLQYRPTPAGYQLSFGDWLVEHVATESQAFEAHK